MDGLVELHERVVPPELAADLLVGNQRAGVADEQHQQPGGLRLQPAPAPLPEKFTGNGIQLELAEPISFTDRGRHVVKGCSANLSRLTDRPVTLATVSPESS